MDRVTEIDRVSESVDAPTDAPMVLRPEPSRLTPPEAPLAMPEQCFARWRGSPARNSGSFGSTRNEFTLAARVLVFSLAGLLTAYGTWEMLAVVGQDSATVLQIVLVLLFAMTFSWISLAAANSLLGALALLAPVDWARGFGSKKELSTRTALVMPIYNEDTERVFANLRRMGSELVEAGQSWHFDIVILSDSTDPDIGAAEKDAAEALRGSLLGRLNVYYRRRPANTGRKAGNIAEFVRRHGGAYDFMLVLDADSYMTAEAMVELARSIEADSSAGLIQTVPRLAGRNTLFARMQQFSTAVYGPVVSAGLALWHGREGNYWGHNAIVRMTAFAEACGLPELAGRKPFGGHIMSHDFVEAALLRRAGWHVYMRPDITGTYEETPPTLDDHALRDRRWAQGNLQHSKVLPATGLHWMSRFHLCNGIMTYVSSPMWLLFLITGMLLAWQAGLAQPDYFPQGYTLFPTWPVFDAQRAWVLLGFSVAVLLAPKALALMVALTKARVRQAFGGAIPLTASVIFEILLSALIAPVLMLVQTKFIGDIMLARDSGWNSQCRDDGSVSLLATLRRYAPHSLIGLGVAGMTFLISPQLFLWLLPVWLGLVLAVPLAFITGTKTAGLATRRMGLLQIPEERRQVADASVPHAAPAWS
jgi:membrane glycosyltransferase